MLVVEVFNKFVFFFQVNLTLDPEAMEQLLEPFKENGEWDIVDYWATREDLYYMCCPEDPYPEVRLLHVVP